MYFKRSIYHYHSPVDQKVFGLIFALKLNFWDLTSTKFNSASKKKNLAPGGLPRKTKALASLAQML